MLPRSLLHPSDLDPSMDPRFHPLNSEQDNAPGPPPKKYPVLSKEKSALSTPMVTIRGFAPQLWTRSTTCGARFEKLWSEQRQRKNIGAITVFILSVISKVILTLSTSRGMN